MQKLNANYVIGLVDGEGSFTVYVRNPKKDSNVARRVKVEPRFYLKLTEEDKNILYALQNFFGCGSVYFQKDTRVNHKNCYRFEVFNRSDLQNKIIPFFRKHSLQLPSKKRDFTLFVKLMSYIEKGEHNTDSGLQKIYNIKQKMH